ncbi:hypothetical protein PYCC9005_002559 [Savitreella phatthalungensis]
MSSEKSANANASLPLHIDLPSAKATMSGGIPLPMSQSHAGHHAQHHHHHQQHHHHHNGKDGHSTPPVPPSPMLRASSYKASDGTIAPLRRTSSFGSSYSATGELIPESESTLDPTLKGNDLQIVVLKMLIKLKLTHWKLADADKVMVKNIASALTNMVYRVVLDDKAFLLRIFGKNVLHLIDREYETSVLARLAHHRIGPRLLGKFKNGRVEQWLDSSEVTAEEAREATTSLYVARRMREFHDHIALVPAERGKLSCLVNINSWVAALPRRKLTPSFRRFLKHIQDYVDWLEQEKIMPSSILPPDGLMEDEESLAARKKAFGAELVLCHNDLQPGNLLRVRGGPGVIEHKTLEVIDFEYAGPNPRAFDLANHFCEWMADYNAVYGKPHKLHVERYPTRQEADNFLQEYLRFGRVMRRAPGDDRPMKAVTPEEMAHLRRQIDLWRPLCNAQWAVWGVVQALPGGEVGSPLTNAGDEDLPGPPPSLPRTQSTASAHSILTTREFASSKHKPENPGMRSPFLGPQRDRIPTAGSSAASTPKSPRWHGTAPISSSSRKHSLPGSSHARSPGASSLLREGLSIPEERENGTGHEEEYFSLGEPAIAELSLDDNPSTSVAKDTIPDKYNILFSPRPSPQPDAPQQHVTDEDWIDEDDNADGFDYLGFTSEKIALFYGDMLIANRLTKQDIPSQFVPRSLGPHQL